MCISCGNNKRDKPGRKTCQTCCDKQNKWYKDSDYKEKIRVNDKQKRVKRRKVVIETYGGRCVCCGESEPLFLSIDHINEDGAKHRAEIMGCPKKGRRIGSTVFYKWLEKNGFPEGFQVFEIGTDYVLGVATDELDVEHVRMYGLTR